jgi:uncharacterized protein (TIGR02453 family)
MDVEPHIFRIQRDTRFARDKTPYKTNLAADVAFRPRGEGEHEHGIPGLYVSIGLDGEYLGMGAWHMAPETLVRFRQLLDDPRKGARVQQLADALRADGYTIEAHEKLKRVPAPYAADHPRAELLKLKGIGILAQPPEDVARTRAFVEWAAARVRGAAPLMQLLDRSLSNG